MLPLDRQLQEANASRKRAWQALQQIRAALMHAGSEVPPVGTPKCFESEGATLRKAPLAELLKLHDRIAALNTAIIGIRPYLGNPKNEAEYPHAILALNRAAAEPRPAAETLRQLREAIRVLR
jgi:hypothetical protein